MRKLGIQLHKYYGDGTYFPFTISLSMTVGNSVRKDAVLDDGRKVVEVVGNEVLLSDEEVMMAESVLYAVIPNLEGMEVPGNVWADERSRTIISGPDRDGRVLFDDGLETILFGLSLGPNNPFPGQRVTTDEHMAQFHEDRRLREAAGLIAQARR